MAYKITITVTKTSHDIPEFGDWINSVPSNFLENYVQIDPSCSGKNPREVLSETVDKVVMLNGVDLKSKLIEESVSVSNDGLTTTYTSIFVDKRSSDLYGILQNYVWETEEIKNQAVAEYDSISGIPEHVNIPAALWPNKNQGSVVYKQTACDYLQTTYRDTYNISITFSGEEI